MKLIDKMAEMQHLNNPDMHTIMTALEDNYHIIVGDKNNYGYEILTYDLFIDDGVLFIGKMSDSTSEDIVITLEMAAIYDTGIFESIWSGYLSGKDVFIKDDMGYMNDATINTGQYTLSTIKDQIKPGEMVYFNDVYANPHVSTHPDTTVYIEDNKDAMFVGVDAIKAAAETVVNTKITTDKSAADFTILILPNRTKAPHNKFYEWLDEDTKRIPVVANTLKEKKMAYDKPHSILLYWSSNVFMTGMFDPNAAAFKAARELEDAITEYHRG